MVSVMRKAFLEQEERNAAEREEMIKRNLERIEADNNLPPPSPTIEEIQAAMAPRKPREIVEDVKAEEAEDKKSDDTVTKTSTAADQGNAGKYNTRDLRGRK